MTDEEKALLLELEEASPYLYLASRIVGLFDELAVDDEDIIFDALAIALGSHAVVAGYSKDACMKKVESAFDKSVVVQPEVHGYKLDKLN